MTDGKIAVQADPPILDNLWQAFQTVVDNYT